MANKFEVELDELEKVGGQNLPMALESLRTAESQTSQARDELEKANTAGEGGDFRIFNPLQWGAAEVLGDLQAAMKHNAEVLDMTAEAVLEIARRYRAADGQH